MKLTRRFPNYWDHGPQTPVEIKTPDELYALDWIQEAWLKDPRFYKFSYGTMGHGMGYYREILMAEMADGTYWAIAWIDDGKLADLGLPEFVKPGETN